MAHTPTVYQLRGDFCYRRRFNIYDFFDDYAHAIYQLAVSSSRLRAIRKLDDESRVADIFHKLAVETIHPPPRRSKSLPQSYAFLLWTDIGRIYRWKSVEYRGRLMEYTCLCVLVLRLNVIRIRSPFAGSVDASCSGDSELSMFPNFRRAEA